MPFPGGSPARFALFSLSGPGCSEVRAILAQGVQTRFPSFVGARASSRRALRGTALANCVIGSSGLVAVLKGCCERGCNVVTKRGGKSAFPMEAIIHETISKNEKPFLVLWIERRANLSI